MIDIAWRAELLNAAVAHHGNAVGQFKGLFLIVRDEDARQTHFIVKATQPAAQFLSYLCVKGAERFVEQQHFGLNRQRTGERNALALSAGELKRKTVRKAVKLDEVKEND